MDTSKLRTSAVRQLARRETSRRELTRKLVARGFEPESVATVVSDLAGRGWQSDKRYAEMLVRHRAAQGYGPLRVVAELGQHGIVDAQACLAHMNLDWFDLALRAREKKFGSLAPQTWQERLRQQRFLVQRGFAMEHIKAAIGSVVGPDADDLADID